MLDDLRTPPGTPATVRLAVVDTDSGFVQVLAKRLEAAGWHYRALSAPPEPDALVEMRLNALVIDLALNTDDPWGYLERVCAEAPGISVVVCSQSSTVAERVRGLRLGADAWIAKPCHPAEVIARVEAVVRRRTRAVTGNDSSRIVAGVLEIRPDRFQAYVGDQSLYLTRREFELLHLLAESSGQVLQREEIYGRVWGYTMAHGDRAVDVFVRKLRQKLDAVSPGWRYIHTHFGIGYRFQPEPPESASSPPTSSSPALGDEDTEAAGAPVAT